ncbi:MAG: alpha/beta fold hydrolase [Candidatus Izemoplasmatales bacterium]
MPWYAIAASAAVLLLLIVLVALGIRIAFGAMHPRRFSLLETRALETERTPDLLQDYDAWEKTSFLVRSPEGYDLKAYYVPADDAPGSPRRFVVVAHGFTYTHHGSIKYASVFKDLGYHVVFYDERYHGESGGPNCTLGGREKDDLRAVIDAVCGRFGSDIFLGLCGESMGAVAALLEQADDPRVRFVVSDCAFADLHDQFRHLVKRHPLIPVWPCLPIGEWIFRKTTGVDPRGVRPLDAVARAKAPILFVHGEGDRYIPPASASRLSAACASPSVLWIAGNGARHAESFRKNRDEYVATVRRFLAEQAHH